MTGIQKKVLAAAFGWALLGFSNADAAENKDDPPVETEYVYLPDIGRMAQVNRVMSEEEARQRIEENPVLAMEAQYNDPSYDPGTTVLTSEKMEEWRKKRKAMIDRPDPL